MKDMLSGTKFCEKCGTPVDGKNTAKAEAVQPTVIVNNTTAPAKKSNGMAVAGFVTSLVNAILCCGSFSLITLILSIVGCVNAKKCDGEGKGLAIAGIIISAIMMVIGLIYWLFFGFAMFASAMEEAGY